MAIISYLIVDKITKYRFKSIKNMYCYDVIFIIIQNWKGL